MNLRDFVGITFDSLPAAGKALNSLNKRTLDYLREDLTKDKKRITIESVSRGGIDKSHVKLYLTRYPGIEFKSISELNEIYSVETEDAFAKRYYSNLPLEEKPEEKEEPDYYNIPHAYKPGEKSNIEKLVAKEMSANLGITPEEAEARMVGRSDDEMYAGTRDMLKTQVISNGPIIPKEEPINEMEKSEPVVETPAPSAPATPVITEAPKIVPKKTLKPKKNKESGVADVVILSVIVIVYIAIIVNLVLRLK